MRYFLHLSYLGTPYCGWQRQPNAASVQETLESALSTILRQPVEVTGCGRTDTGVHARFYVAHFDAIGTFPPTFLQGLNSILPDSIAVQDFFPVPDAMHARYDAFERSYEYHIALRKDPFSTQTAWFYPQHDRLDRALMEQVAALIPQFDAFYPFCKTNSGTTGYSCTVKKSTWISHPDEHRLVFHITANRFLRGMVRLIVGACIQAGTGQTPVNIVENALRTQQSLPKSLSVPAHGLYLTEVKYPEFAIPG
jgi:tRNA pseudouridine38-40 synthase